MSKSMTSPEMLKVFAKERRAVEMRSGGASLDEIAAELGYASKSGAHKAVRRGMERYVGAAPEELRALELERTEAILKRLWPLVNQDPPDLAALDRLMRVMDFRARITGLFAPSQHQVAVAVDATVTTTSVQDYQNFERLLAEVIERKQLPTAEAQTADVEDDETADVGEST